MGLHDRSALSPYIFLISVNVLSEGMRKEVLESTVFADDIILSGRFCQVCAFFPRKPICRTDVGGDGSGGCFSAAAGQLHHSITL